MVNFFYHEEKISGINSAGLISKRVSSKGVSDRAPLRNVVDFFIPKVPFWGFLVVSNSKKSDRFP